MNRSRSLPVALLIAAALLTAPALVGCGQVKIPDVVTGSDSGDGSGGSVGTGLPADFPSEVPLPEGDVMLGTKAGDKWLVSLKVADESVLDEADQLLEDAGYTEVSDGSHVWEGDDYNVVISIAGTNAGFVLNYIVTAN